MTDDLATFSAARLAEDEAAARKAMEETRHCCKCDALADGHWVRDPAWPPLLRDAGSRVTIVYEDDPREGVLTHIGLHDPARALREVAAGRRILNRHECCAPYGGGPCDHAGTVDDPPCSDMRDLAARWSDHPEYRKEWRP